ncbi:MAG: nucleotide sugar dehydrogenase [Candidatus Bathycorpusculaceae bacterium]
MSLSMLQLKPEDVDTMENRSKYTVSIIGCGQTGVLHAYFFTEAGFRVICADLDQRTVSLLSRGKATFLSNEIKSKLKMCLKSGKLEVTNNVKNAVSNSNIIVITTPFKIDEKRRVDYSDLRSVCKHVGLGLRQSALVIIAATVGLGFTESVIRQILENASGLKAGVDFGLVYSPFQTLDEKSQELLANKRLVAGIEKNSLNSASVILNIIAKGRTKKAANVKEAEFAELFRTLQRNVNIALADEIAIICENAGIDFLEILKLLSDDAHCVFSTPKFIEKNALDEICLLLEEAENLNTKLRIPTVVEKINEETVRHVLNLTRSALKEAGKTLRRAKITLLGITQTPNMKSQPKTTAKVFAEMLEAKGAKISFYDPYLSEEELAEIRCPFKKNLTESLDGADCIVIVTGHEQFKHLNLKKLKVMMRMPAAIIDLEGVIEPNEIRKEGIIYRGLGRGVTFT